jgi:hypothetical protein
MFSKRQLLDQIGDRFTGILKFDFDLAVSR